MPELPEVQTIVSDLKKKIIGRKIADVWFDAPKLIKKPESKDLRFKIKDLRIIDIKRRGKNILIYLINPKSNPPVGGQNQKILLIHQKLTGHLLYGQWKIKSDSKRRPEQSEGSQVLSLINGALAEKVNNYIHFILYLDNGWQIGLSDLRKFAKIVFGSQEEIENLAEIKNLGPEPLNKSLKAEKFKSLISERKGKIKQVLMDQNVIAGIGNIYADEILWQAKIHPFKPANELSEKELKEIFLAMKQILKKAVKLRGTSVSDFRDASGQAGKYINEIKVYQREGEPCFRCQTPIKRVKMGGRSSHFCSKCQKVL